MVYKLHMVLRKLKKQHSEEYWTHVLCELLSPLMRNFNELVFSLKYKLEVPLHRGGIPKRV